MPDCAAQQFSGVVFDDDMGDELRVTIIITGITESDALGDISAEPSLETIRDTVAGNGFVSGRDKKKMQEIQNSGNGVSLKVPAIMRRQM